MDAITQERDDAPDLQLRKDKVAAAAGDNCRGLLGDRVLGLG